MLTPPLPPSDERRLKRLYRGLEEESRRTLLRFAEFLASEEARAAKVGLSTQKPVPEIPDPLPRPEGESVVGAIKRLALSYHMLDRRHMLEETSSLMAAHVLNGRPARDVIEELEALFARHYDAYRERFEP